MNITNKQITTLLCSLAFLLCFADGLSAQKITAKTKSGYISPVEFLDVVDDSLKFKNEAGKTLTLPLKDFEKSTLISIVIENEKKNGTYGLEFGDLNYRYSEESKTDEPLEQAIAKSTELKIGPDEDSYFLRRVLGVTGRKLVIDESGFSFANEILADERPLSKFDEPSLILIATRFIKAAKEKEKAAGLAEQAKLESKNQMEDDLAAQKRGTELFNKIIEGDNDYIPKKRFDHCWVTVTTEAFVPVLRPGEERDMMQVKIKKTRTLTSDDGGRAVFTTHLSTERDPNPDWLDKFGSSGWEIFKIERAKITQSDNRTTYYFKREK